ncbi:MAG: ABC transporter ATP-binding protein [Pseudomonadales bacterium]|nr:ABC transporter ATP-binding protein [Pseudomonadales bacterium]
MIKVTNVSKTYQIWRSPLSRLLVPLARKLVRPFAPQWFEAWQLQQCEAVVALQDISFELGQGDSLGIIGLNGSGKSTLLQIIAGTLGATHGEVEIKGRVAALLELGSGFDPEFTGIENIYLNASILGLSREETNTRFDDIVAFADIGDFIHRQVKTYSSGMMVRLAFAVQVHVDPDILIVDEALAVGDARFQAKALTKLDQILAKGTTLLFVGHDLNTVKSFCNSAMLLDHGQVIQQGLPDDVIAHYLHLVQQHASIEAGGKSATQIDRGFAVSGFGITEAVIDGYGQHGTVTYNQQINIQIHLKLADSCPHPCLILDVIDARGLQLTGQRIPIPAGAGIKHLQVGMKCCFQMGIYRFRMRIVNSPSLDQTTLLSRQDNLLSMQLIDDVRDKFTGLFPVPMSCEWL